RVHCRSLTARGPARSARICPRGPSPRDGPAMSSSERSRKASGTGPGALGRALVLQDSSLLVDLIELTLNHGLFVVRAAQDLGQAEEILDGWHPHIGVVDMDNEGSTALLEDISAVSSLAGSVVPVLGLTRRGDLQTKLRAFDLGVDDILT